MGLPERSRPAPAAGMRPVRTALGEWNEIWNGHVAVTCPVARAMRESLLSSDPDAAVTESWPGATPSSRTGVIRTLAACTSSLPVGRSRCRWPAAADGLPGPTTALWPRDWGVGGPISQGGHISPAEAAAVLADVAGGTLAAETSYGMGRMKPGPARPANSRSRSVKATSSIWLVASAMCGRRSPGTLCAPAGYEKLSGLGLESRSWVRAAVAGLLATLTRVPSALGSDEHELLRSSCRRTKRRLLCSGRWQRSSSIPGRMWHLGGTVKGWYRSPPSSFSGREPMPSTGGGRWISNGHPYGRPQSLGTPG